MVTLTSAVVAAFAAVAAIVTPGKSKLHVGLPRVPRLPRVRGQRGDHRDAVSEDMRRAIDAATIPLLY